MLIIILIITTFLQVAWLLLLSRGVGEDIINIAYNTVFNNCDLIEKINKNEKNKLEKLSRFDGIAANGINFLFKIYHFIYPSPDKKIQKLINENEALKNGDLRKLNILTIPGYVLQREFDVFNKSSLYTTILKKCNELFGKKHFMQKARHIYAAILSYAALGTALTLLVSLLFMSFGGIRNGAPVLGIGLAIIFVSIYAIYDDLESRVNKRRESINKEFPAVVSKLALLVTSGMIMDKAWKLTALSRDSELYIEMRQTSDEMDNLKSPDIAYAGFINRCNTKETTKLAGAIMQNLSKGNAQLGRILKDMAHEAWLNRQHKAKRDASAANSKLMIPTMMLFLTILIMLMVPIMMSFSTM